MAGWSWRRWFRGVDYEHELPRLADQMRAAQLALDRARARQRKVPALILVVALVMYAVYALGVIVSQSARRPAHTAGLVLTPVLLWQLFVNLRRGLALIVRRRERALKTLTDRRRRLVDEYKKKTNFDKIRELVADPDAPEHDKARAQADLKSRKRRERAGPDQRTGQPSVGRSAAGSGQPAGQLGAGAAADAAGSAGSGAGSVGGALPSGARPADPRSIPGPARQFAPPPYRRTWVDRLVDLVLGENEMSPANRDALICPECFSHNGLAPFGKSAKDITYRCPVCGHFNAGAKEAAGVQGKSGAAEVQGSETVAGENGDAGARAARADKAAARKRDDAEPASAQPEPQAGKDASENDDSSLSDAPARQPSSRQSSSRQSSPADSIDSAKSLSKHLEGPADEAQNLMSVEERIMQEIHKIQDEIDASKAVLAKDKA